jgi:XTP/dITP diphosphohydrolase
MRVVLASGNPGKLKEMRSLLSQYPIECASQTELGIDDAEETGLTFVENALIKARHACTQSGLPALADDSGLCVHALGGAPGLISARYAGKHGDAIGNINKLLLEMQGVEDRRAYFVSVIVYLRHAADPRPIVAQGIWPGKILHNPKGSLGFGYDPIFFDTELSQSAAELAADVKDLRSHRGLALRQLLNQLELEGLQRY